MILFSNNKAAAPNQLIGRCQRAPIREIDINDRYRGTAVVRRLSVLDGIESISVY